MFIGADDLSGSALFFKHETNCPDWQLQERHGLQVLFDYRVHDHLEDNLDVGGVGCRGEVVVDEFVRRGVE